MPFLEKKEWTVQSQIQEYKDKSNNIHWIKFDYLSTQKQLNKV